MILSSKGGKAAVLEPTQRYALQHGDLWRPTYYMAVSRLKTWITLGMDYLPCIRFTRFISSSMGSLAFNVPLLLWFIGIFMQDVIP